MGEQSINDPIEEPAEPLPVMRLEALVPRMTSPALRRAPEGAVPVGVAVPSTMTDTPGTTVVPGSAAVPWAGSVPSVGLELALVTAVAAIAGLLVGDVRIGILAVSLGIATTGLRRVERVLPFSIGEGFIGYRPDDGWPQGVQEDDDVHWNWRPVTAAPGAPAPGSASVDRYS